MIESQKARRCHCLDKMLTPPPCTLKLWLPSRAPYKSAAAGTGPISEEVLLTEQPQKDHDEGKKKAKSNQRLRQGRRSDQYKTKYSVLRYIPLRDR